MKFNRNYCHIELHFNQLNQDSRPFPMFVCGGGGNPENLEMDLKIRLEGCPPERVLRLADMKVKV